MADDKILIVGSNGQLGKALKIYYPRAQAIDSDTLDISDEDAVLKYDFSGIKYIFNAAAYTNVDGAETNEGRRIAWEVNATGARNLAVASEKHAITLVHISTDYVFDGTKENHNEEEAFSPLSVYGSSKAAGDIAVGTILKYYILRTSWVIGDGKNFVRTMLELGKKGVSPTVVSDQVGRLTFTDELVKCIDHLLKSDASYGAYNITNDGQPVSWADITRVIYDIGGYSGNVTDISTAQYYSGKTGIALRPLKSTLDLSKLKEAGFNPLNWRENLIDYIKKEAE